MKINKLRRLSVAVDEYGELSYRIYKAAEAFGRQTLKALPRYLGDGGQALGVPPQGCWDLQIYGGEAFSTYKAGPLEVGPIQMGIAVRIPHIKDDGELWVRLLVEFSPVPGALDISVAGRAPIRSNSLTPQQEDLEIICEEAFQALMESFAGPAELATSVKLGYIGFAQPQGL